MTGAQVQEARKLLGWTPERLGALSDVPSMAIRVFEATGRLMLPKTPQPHVDRAAAIRSTLEAAGVEFTIGDDSGVKLRKPDP